MPTASPSLAPRQVPYKRPPVHAVYEWGGFHPCVQGIEEQIILNAKQAEQCIDSIADEAVDDGLTGDHGSGFGCVCHVSFSMICR